MPRKLDSTPEPPEPDSISLDALAAAFAEVMGKPPKSRDRSNDADLAQQEGHPQHDDESIVDSNASISGRSTFSRSGGASLDDELAAMEDSGPITPIGILEAMLFVGDRDGRPLSAAGASDLMRGVEPAEIAALVSELNRRYEASGAPYFIEGDAGGYCLALRKPFHPLRESFLGKVREAKLSQAAIDALAVVAYQQPLTVDQINAMRGKPCNHVLSQLVHRGLLRIERKPGKKRLAQYFTTDRFLQLFGLQTLADLPQSEEVER